jgi:hypothetical protein
MGEGLDTEGRGTIGCCEKGKQQQQQRDVDCQSVSEDSSL